MKSIVLLLSSCILLCNTVMAQEEKPTTTQPGSATEASASLAKEPVNMNVFQFSPIHLLASQFKIGYERYFGKNPNSILLMAGVILQEKGQDTRNGASAELHFRISVLDATYPNSSMRLFAGPFLKYKFVEKNEEKYSFWQDPVMVKSTITTATGGVIAGLELSIVDRVSFNLYMGGGAKYSESSDGSEQNSIFDAAYTGIVPEAGFLLGFKF
ncbi:MAG TPA: hypothetical protein EYN69_01885 [Flavobacteriales bacterium]|nr:hypothetical protein [Flavobacteriales bacterium]